jgi:hypothetical protein
MSNLAAAAKAYRAQRERYWVKRRVVGETVTGGGTVSIFATDVQLADGKVVFSGTEEDAKAWLDLTCLRAALTNLLAET